MRFRFQTLNPKVAATALRALDSFITGAVRCRKTQEPDWSTLFQVISSARLCFWHSSSLMILSTMCQTCCMWLFWLMLVEYMQVPLMEGALLNAPAKSAVAFVLSICKALHAHVLPDPSSQPHGQVGLPS